jgi:putative ABC transport system substrate-binding protein
MKRREFITIMGDAAAEWPPAARAQQAGHTYRLGSLQFSPRRAVARRVFVPLRWQGFVEGQNLVGDSDGYSLRVDQLAAHAAELVKAKVDVIVAAGDPNVSAAQQATKTLPILAIAEDLVDSGFIASLAKPGGNTSGVSILTSALNGKRQEILLELVPGMRIAALADTNSISPPSSWTGAARRFSHSTASDHERAGADLPHVAAVQRRRAAAASL